MSPFTPVKAPRWLAVLGVVAVPALPVAAWIVGTQVSDNTSYSQAIQESRRDSVLASCEEQNGRHDATIKALDRVLARAIARNPDRAVQIRESRTNTVLLIDALAPKRDCRERVQQFADIKPDTP